MRSKWIKLPQTALLYLLLMFMVSHSAAQETIIQQEEISFEKCLKVIAISENKLSVAPEVKDISDQKRVALFKLFDGTLKITCDGIDGTITVSTKQTS